MRRALALASATAAWVLLIQVASTAMSPPVIVELSPVDVSRAADAPPILLPTGNATVTTTSTTSHLPSVTIGPITTTTAVPSTTATTLMPVTTTPAPPPAATTTAGPVTTAPAPPPAATTTAAPATTTTATPITTTTATPVTTTTGAPVAGAFSFAAESDFLSRINGLRSSVGLAGLSANSELNNYARWWAKQMADSGNFLHSDFPSLLDPWWVVGENVGYGPTVASIFDYLVASSLHYTNMVDARFTSVGVGAYVDATSRIWTAHVFGG